MTSTTTGQRARSGLCGTGPGRRRLRQEGRRTAFLLKQQCPSGWFPTVFNTDKRRRPVLHGRREGPRPTSPRSPCSAGLQDNAGRGHRDHQGEGVAGLQQKTDGSWSVAPAPPTRTAPALPPGHSVTLPASAGSGQWLRARQATDTRATSSRVHRRDRLRQRGLTAGRRDGITDETQDQWRRASSQSVPALATSRRTPPVRPGSHRTQRIPEGRLHPWPDHEGGPLR